MATINNQRFSGEGFRGTSRSLVPCKVKRIIMDGSSAEAANWGGYDAVGMVYFKKVNQKNSTPNKNAEINENPDIMNYDGIAKPLFPFLKYYPLINEIVPVITLTSKEFLNSKEDGEMHYYLPPINLWNHPHHNTLPALSNYTSGNNTGELRKNEDYLQAGLLRRSVDGELEYDIPLGEYFQEKLNIKPLLPYEGDHILEGRFGNSIRFGSTARSNTIPVSQSNNWSVGAKGEIGDPITIIRNGQAEGLDMQGWVHTLEDINLDASSIYLTSNQKIDNFVIAAPDCWYSFGLNTVIPQDPNQEAKKFLDSPVDFVQANEDESVEDIEETKAGSNNQSIINQNQRITAQIDPTFEQDEETNNSTIQYNNTEFVQENQDSNIISEEEIENENYNEEKLDSIQSNLFTKGGEYLLNGENYVGPYHIHPDKGAMAGAQHIPQTHYFLEPVVGYSPGPYVNVIGKYFDGVGKNKEFNEAENLARQDALSKVYSKIGNTNVNVIFGENFQTKTPTRYINDGELEVYYTYKVESIV